MKIIQKCKTTDLEVRLLLMALPSGFIPKRAVMRLVVSDYLPDDFTEQEETRLRYSVIRAAIKNGLLKKKTFTTRVHNKANNSIVYILTYAGIDFLALVAGDAHNWIRDVAEFYRSRMNPLYDNPSRNGEYFYRYLTTRDFELLATIVHPEISEGFISGSANIAIRNAIREAYNDFEENDPAYDDEADEVSSEHTESNGTLQSTCYAAFLAQHPDEPLIETILPDLPCDGLFVSSRLFPNKIDENVPDEQRKHFLSNALGVYLNQNNSFMVFSTTKYGMTWDQTAIKGDMKRFQIASELFGYKTYPADALIMVDNAAQFAELFENKWKRKRVHKKGKMTMQVPFTNVYAIPTGPEGCYQLELAEYFGPGFDRAMVNIVCRERHYGYVQETGGDQYKAMYNGYPMMIGSSLNVSQINTVYQDYCVAKKKGKPFEVCIYCETWQKEWFERLFPDLEIYTEDDIPQRSEQEGS